MINKATISKRLVLSSIVPLSSSGRPTTQHSATKGCAETTVDGAVVDSSLLSKRTKEALTLLQQTRPETVTSAVDHVVASREDRHEPLRINHARVARVKVVAFAAKAIKVGSIASKIP